jgi:hypothetical protein
LLIVRTQELEALVKELLLLSVGEICWCDMDLDLFKPNTHNSAIGCARDIRLDVIHRPNSEGKRRRGKMRGRETERDRERDRER